MEETKPVVMERANFEFRDKILLLAPFRFFGLARIRFQRPFCQPNVKFSIENLVEKIRPAVNRDDP